MLSILILNADFDQFFSINFNHRPTTSFFLIVSFQVSDNSMESEDRSVADFFTAASDIRNQRASGNFAERIERKSRVAHVPTSRVYNAHAQSSARSQTPAAT